MRGVAAADKAGLLRRFTLRTCSVLHAFARAIPLSGTIVNGDTGFFFGNPLDAERPAGRC